MPGLRNWVSKYDMFMAAIKVMLAILYCLIFYSAMGCNPTLALFKNKTRDRMNNVLRIKMHATLKYQPLLMTNRGAPFPE